MMCRGAPLKKTHRRQRCGSPATTRVTHFVGNNYNVLDGRKARFFRRARTRGARWREDGQGEVRIRHRDSNFVVGSRFS
jgi:hypothetical protein